MSLDVWETVPSDDRLSGNSTDSDHGKSAIQELRGLLLCHLVCVLGRNLGQAEVCKEIKTKRRTNN
jgi:hypothetical protein